MREIKFRAWNKNTKTMIDLQKTTPLALHPDLDCDGIFIPFHEDWPVMQYTGLRDRTGKEIYNGDILLRKVDERYGPAMFRVAMSKRGFWAVYSESGLEGLLGENNQVCEVIGNVFEHPELLTKG